jgi:16S rRNA (uracil1498-N3)-methyltransferase
MRLSPGAAVLIFNGRDGEWRARLNAGGKKGGSLTVEVQTRPQTAPPDVWLVFAPVKKAAMDVIVAKAVELGAARLVPVQTEFTKAERIRDSRLRAQVIEAAEQCGATYVPEVAELTPLPQLLAGWGGPRRMWFCDESPDAPRQPAFAAFAAATGPAAIAIGPEGGFSPAERARLRALPFVTPVTLGPRILRAETAALAALTLWQAVAGDWAERTLQ